jgi:hypothetical protein
MFTAPLSNQKPSHTARSEAEPAIGRGRGGCAGGGEGGGLRGAAAAAAAVAVAVAVARRVGGGAVAAWRGRISAAAAW